MSADPNQAQDEITRLQQRAATVTQVLQEARSVQQTGSAPDGTAEAVAAGGRLISLTLTSSSARVSHDQLVAGMLAAAKDALRASNATVQQATAGLTELRTRPGASGATA